jgi:hypothetical protein
VNSCASSIFSMWVSRMCALQPNWNSGGVVLIQFSATNFVIRRRNV